MALAAAVVAALCLAVSFAQQIASSQVPAPVKAGVQTRFPGAKVTEWKVKGKDYEAEFNLNKIDIAAKFDATGEWLETETTIALREFHWPFETSSPANLRATKWWRPNRSSAETAPS